MKVTQAAIPMRPLGKTGVEVSMIGLGGAHIGHGISSVEAVKLIRAAIDAGITFMDNSWDYYKGESERRLGRALKDGYRQGVFVMTKIDGRSRKEAARQLDESLRRLRVDEIDLLQHHEVIRFEDADRIFAEGGAMEALEAAKKAGKVRFIGFTGHKDPAVHLYMLDIAARQGRRMDTVQMPLNPCDYHFRSFERQVLPRAVQERVAVLGMKSLGYGIILKSGKITAAECLRYALSLPTSVVITGIDSARILKQALSVASDFVPMTDAEMSALRDRAAAIAADGKYELFKTSAIFDATAHNPKWLGEDSSRALRLAG